MPDWLQILLTIIITLGIIAIIVLFALKIYHKLNKTGTCVFVSYSPSTSGNSSYTQTGYISCSGGGSSWRPTKLNILNQGPGDFYIGPISGQSVPQEILSGKYYNYDMNAGIEPNIYYSSGSQYTTPNFTITVT